MTVLNICDNGDVLSIIRIIKIVINIIRIVVPIILIISISLTLVSVVKDKESDALNKSFKGIISKSIAAILVFLIPTFVNILANISDSDQSYLSCIKVATSENILAAYRLQAEKLIDNASESLTNSDYMLAKSAINKIKDESVKKELLDELDVIGEYIALRNEIYLLAKDYDREKYNELKKKLEAISDEKVRERLLQELKEAIGKNGSMDQFITDPNDPLYRNLKNFSGTTLSDVLARNGSSVEKLNLQIQEAVEQFGVGTREAPVAAALTLIQTLAEYGYRINYYWGGKWYNIGVNGSWGAPTSPISCDTHPNPDGCRQTMIWKGLDCSGFANWALIQGFQDNHIPVQRTRFNGTEISLAGQSSAVCDIGDVMVSGGHIVLVAGIEEDNKRYLVAESTGGGVKLSYYPFNSYQYKCRKIDYSN